MSILKKLFGGGGAAAPEPEVYEGYSIFPEPGRDGNRYRIGARIEKEVGGDLKVHNMIRADVFESADVAVTESIAKAKTMIDQMGDGLFD
ncbi:MAG: HlyU family transcriptional regulator [Pseudomonadota bacterium]